MIALYIAGLLTIFVAMYFVCGELEKSCGALAFRLGLPESVAGATLLAVSSSSPEFFTSFIGALTTGHLEIGLMVILWSAIFNITIIPGVSAIVSKEELKVSPTVVTRDCVSYLAITLLLMGLLSDEILSKTDAMILLGAYFLYIYVLFLMLDSDDEPEEVVLPTWRVAAGFIGGIAIVGGLCHGMIILGGKVSAGWGIPIALVSALIFAPGTSIPDLFLSVFAAKRGAGSASIANAYGSNSFDLTICLAAPVLIVPKELHVSFEGRTLYSVWMLLGSVILSMIFVRSGYTLSKREGWILVTLFFVLAVTICFVGGDTSAVAEATSTTTSTPAVAH